MDGLGIPIAQCLEILPGQPPGCGGSKEPHVYVCEICFSAGNPLGHMSQMWPTPRLSETTELALFGKTTELTLFGKQLKWPYLTGSTISSGRGVTLSPARNNTFAFKFGWELVLGWILSADKDLNLFVVVLFCGSSHLRIWEIHLWLFSCQFKTHELFIKRDTGDQCEWAILLVDLGAGRCE